MGSSLKYVLVFVNLMGILLVSFYKCESMSNEVEASKIHFQSSEISAGLIELYTSEGCSSCPPAEKYFSDFQKNKELFKTLFPVAFHVNYWDYLGWTDKLSQEKYTRRQRRLASLTPKKSIYTPGVYVNGKSWAGWRDLQTFPVVPLTGVLSADVDRNNVSLVFRSPSSLKNIEFHVVFLGMNLKSSIKAGERTGENTLHQFVVLDYQFENVRYENKNATKSFSLSVKPTEAKPQALVVWVTEVGSSAPMQMAGGFLEKK